MTEPIVQYDDIILPADRPNVDYDIEEQLAAEATGQFYPTRKSNDTASHSNAAAATRAPNPNSFPRAQQQQRPRSHASEEPPSDTGSIHTENEDSAGDTAGNDTQTGPGGELAAEDEVEPLKLKAPRKPIRNFQQHDLLGPRGVPALQQLFSATLPTLTGKRKREVCVMRTPPGRL